MFNTLKDDGFGLFKSEQFAYEQEQLMQNANEHATSVLNPDDESINAGEDQIGVK